jgi:hypothetical protein
MRRRLSACHVSESLSLFVSKVQPSLTWPESLLRSSSYGASAKREKVAL